MLKRAQSWLWYVLRMDGSGWGLYKHNNSIFHSEFTGEASNLRYCVHASVKGQWEKGRWRDGVVDVVNERARLDLYRLFRRRTEL